MELSSHGERAGVTGDSIHHPVQLAHPRICSCADLDPGLAARTRHRLLDSLAGTPALLLGTHLPPPTAGAVRRAGDAYRLVPAPPEQH